MSEQRRSLRIPVEATVLVDRDGAEPVCLKIRDLSDHGVYLVCDQAVSLPIDSEVVLQVEGLEDAPRIPARVVRCDTEGVGLMFREIP